MPNKKNKVKFNICNVHYALITVDEDGEVTFGTPVAMPGAVSLSLEPNGEPSNFYADGYAYYTISNNMGYEGDLELAMVPESFRTDVLKESLDTNQVLVENANVETANFALLFEFDGDIKKIRHVLYNCSAARPNIESTTNEEEIEVQTETLAITAAPLANGYVKARTGDSTTDTVYTGWYSSVYMPETAEPVDPETQQAAPAKAALFLPGQQGRRKPFLALKQRHRRENHEHEANDHDRRTGGRFQGLRSYSKDLPDEIPQGYLQRPAGPGKEHRQE